MTLSENTIIEIENILNDHRNFTYKHETICFGLQLDSDDKFGQEVGRIISEENISNYTKISQIKGISWNTVKAVS